MYKIVNEEELNLVSGGVLTTAALIAIFAGFAVGGCVVGTCCAGVPSCGICCRCVGKFAREEAQRTGRTIEEVRHEFIHELTHCGRHHREEAQFEGVEVRQ